MKSKGLVLVNTGNGKGKTTAALGIAMRSAGHGMKVSVVQFIKGKWKTGEREAANRLGFELITMGQGFTWDSKDVEEDKRMMREAWKAGREKILSGEYDLVILDEINYVLGYGHVPVEEVLDCLKARPDHVNVILTGHNALDEVIEVADLATEMREIKHPFKKGVPAQKGIDF